MDKTNPKQVYFCSTASRYFKEALQGTAANYKGFIMVEHASPFPQKPTDGLLNKDWLKTLDKLAKRKSSKLLLIRNKATDYKNCRIIYVDCVQQKYFVIHTSVEEAHKINLESYIEDTRTVWEVDPFFVVCTNGKKDKCCAKFGFPVFKFFENIHLPFCYTAWECTHIGGDRFAANAALMPYGIYYGRIGVEDVHEIIKETAFGRIRFQNYRGISKLSFFDQAVECYLREHLSEYGIDFAIDIIEKKRDGDLITVKVVVNNEKKFEMILKQDEIDYPHLLTCTSHKPEKIVKYVLESIRENS